MTDTWKHLSLGSAVICVYGMVYIYSGQHTNPAIVPRPNVDKLIKNNNRTTMGYITHLGPPMTRHRLGNQMFEYSGLVSTAKIMNRSPLLGPNYDTMRKIFRLSFPATHKVASMFRGTRRLGIGPDVNSTLQRCHELANHSGNLNLIGWTHDYRYFEDVDEQVRSEFTFTSRVRDEVRAFFERMNLLGNDTVKVGMHLRRGDATQRYWIKRGMAPPPLSYFRKAQNYFTSRFKNVYFVICSEDLKWARANLAGDNVVFSNNTNAGLDMAILASCDHIIIGQGTFGWWAGWLNTGITVRYSELPNKGYAASAADMWPPNGTHNHYVSIDS